MSRFSVVKKGYDTEEVDAYVEQMESVIKSYKEKDSAIKNAILNAQVAADSIVANAKNQAAEMKRDSLRQLADIRNSVSVQRQLLSEFQRGYNEMANRYLVAVNSQDFAIISAKIDNIEKYLSGLETGETEAPGGAQTE